MSAPPRLRMRGLYIVDIVYRSPVVVSFVTIAERYRTNVMKK